MFIFKIIENYEYLVKNPNKYLDYTHIPEYNNPFNMETEHNDQTGHTTENSFINNKLIENLHQTTQKKYLINQHVL